MKLISSKAKISLQKAVNFLIPGESMGQSKNKWNTLASKNSRYFVMTDFGEDITEEKYRETGEKDYNELIGGDDFIKNKLGIFEEKTALEIGCGTGRVTEFLAKHFKKVFAVDISEEMVAEGRRRLASAANIEFTAINGTDFPSIKESSIDFVFSYIVFQHMPNKKVIKRNFEEVARVLKNDGVAKIQVRGLPTNKFNWFYGPSFTKKEIAILIAKTNLKLLKTEGENQRYFWLWLSK